MTLIPISGNLDSLDARIIEALLENGRISITELAGKVGLSKSPCHQRMKRLIDDGIIQGFCAVIDPRKLGLDHVAYTEVRLADTREATLRDFDEAVGRIREVEECHMIAGSYDYLLKVRTASMRRYRQVLGECISTLPHVASTSTFVVMESIKDMRLPKVGGE